MKHYICTGGCEGVSATPGTCGAQECPKHGLPLIECNCTDGKHAEILAAAKSAERHEEVQE